jgi:hypothetical protein
MCIKGSQEGGERHIRIQFIFKNITGLLLFLSTKEIKTKTDIPHNRGLNPLDKFNLSSEIKKHDPPP